MEKDLQGFSALGWTPFNVFAADIAGVGFKTEPTTPHQIGGVRLSQGSAQVLDTYHRSLPHG